MQLDHAEPTATIDDGREIVRLANEARAGSIASDARHIIERLDSARLSVAIVGGPNTVGAIASRIVASPNIPVDVRVGYRFARKRRARVTLGNGTVHDVSVASAERLLGDARAIEWFVDAPLLRHGVCLSIGMPLDRRADIVLTGTSEVAHVERGWPRPTTIVVNIDDDDDIDAALATIERLAIECGAARVEDHTTQYQRHSCMRLGHHLVEQHRALIRPQAALLARIHALAIARMLAESVLDARRCRPDPIRDALLAWLTTERTKFLMATKADALAALDERLAEATYPRQQLRHAAASASHAIAFDRLTPFWRRISGEADKPISALSKRLVEDLQAALGDLGDELSPQALAGLDLPPIRGCRILDWQMPASVVTEIVDRFGLASRRRILRAARDALAETLASKSRQMVDLLVLDYDDACESFERRVRELLDAAIQSVHVAAEVAQQAQAGGPDRVARERQRISQWSAELADVVARLG